MPDRSAEERELARQERERRRLALARNQDGAPRGEPAAHEDDWLPDEPEPLPLAAEPPEGADGRQPVRSPRPRARSVTARGSSRPTATSRSGAPGAGRTGRHSRAGRVLAVVAILVVVLVLWFLVELFQPFSGSGHGRVTVIVPPHATTGQIADILDRQGVISCAFPSCSFLFELRAKLDGSTLLSGTYHLRLGMSFGAVISALSSAPPAAAVKEVTIIPGETRLHVSQLLRSQHVAGSYLAATKHSSLLNPKSYGAPASTPDLEGFLFPDTYQLKVPISISALVADQLTDFRHRFGAVNLSWAHSQHLTAYDVLIVASLVQAEAQAAPDFPLVASTIYNRLRIGMPLELDSTTRYATDNYNHPLTVSQLKSPSPWNTHTHRGLPPTPIDSPALSAIQAAAHPASTNYLYFVSKPCRSGALAFSANYTQQLVNEQLLTAAHGRLSSKC